MKTNIMMILGGLMVIGTAHADFQPAPSTRGGFVSDTETIVTVDQVGSLRDDTYVVVQGNIVRRVSGDKYLFQDSTGTMTVEIDDEGFNGLTVTPNDTIKMYGEVDRGLTKTEIDIDYIEKVQ